MNEWLTTCKLRTWISLPLWALTKANFDKLVVLLHARNDPKLSSRVAFYNVGHFKLEFSPAPLSMLETQTESMENNFLNNIELGERGVFFSNSFDHGCRWHKGTAQLLYSYVVVSVTPNQVIINLPHPIIT